jgi:hypothetical protein
MKKIILIASLILLFAAEITRVYYIMPFPGSQKSDSIDYAYWIHNNILWMRMALIALVLNSLIPIFKRSRILTKVLLVLVLVFYAVIFYYFNYRFQADQMFRAPTTITFKDSAANKVDEKKLVVGVVIDGEAKAYPIQVIGYHHQIRDSLSNTPVMITYCTVCRTGRAFSPLVNGKPENFRLVGMDHFNAMFEDATTKSWWQQATGVAVAGQLKGQALRQIPSAQTTLAAWLRRYPQSLVLQPDTVYNKQYASLRHFDDGTTKDDLEKRDSASWQFKSWVIGVDQNHAARAYDWNTLVSNPLIQDSLPGLPLVITLEKDTASFHVLRRTTSTGETLNFKLDPGQGMTDTNTGSMWTLDGTCVSGPLEGQKLNAVQASQEFWHSWRTFHPNTSTFSYAVH